MYLVIYIFLWISSLSVVESVSLFRHRKLHPIHDDYHSHDVCYYRYRDDYVCDEFFSYRRDSCYGPTNWYKVSACFRACEGNRQSPINVNHGVSRYHPRLQPIILRPQSVATDTQIANNGNHAPEFDAEDLSYPTLRLYKPLTPGRFDFKNVHVHLGRRSPIGSEHSLNNKFTPLEAHLVFYNIDDSPSFSIAKNDTGGLMVIAVFIKTASDNYFGPAPTDAECAAIMNESRDSNNRECPRNRRCRDWRCRCPRSPRAGSAESASAESNENEGGSESKCPVKFARRFSKALECAYRNQLVKQFNPSQDPDKLPVEIHPDDVLPCECDRKYYAYPGSLTTPPCTENVQWLVMKCPIYVSRRVLRYLQQVESNLSGQTLKTYGDRRPRQSLNNRRILRNFRD